MAYERTKTNGITRCIRYSFMPNRLHLCGPDNQADILEFYANGSQQKKISRIQPLLEGFETMYPYLKLIAAANGLKNPFAEEIVEAYWLGNQKLDSVPANKLFRHIIDKIQLGRKVSQKEHRAFVERFNLSALPHHNFHVYSIWRRTGKTETAQTLATMEACRINRGKIIKIKPHTLTVETKPLAWDKKGKLFESNHTVEREILNSFEGNILLKNTCVGDFISFHWGCACEILNKKQITRLQYYNNLSLQFAIAL